MASAGTLILGSGGLGPASIIQFSTDGAFGTGMLNFTNTTNNHLQPLGGTRTVANPVTMLFGFTVESATGDTTSGLTFTGPIALAAIGRTITNNLASGATLTLGSSTTPSTLSLSTGASTQTLVLGGTGRYVINDVIQNSSPGNPNNLSLTTTSSVTFKAQNTYSGTTTLTSSGSSPVTVLLGTNSNDLPGASFTSGPLGTGTVIMNNSSGPPILVPLSADRTVSNAITMTTGFFAASASAAQDPTGPHNLTLAGPMSPTTSGRVLTNNLAPGCS